MTHVPSMHDVGPFDRLHLYAESLIRVGHRRAGFIPAPRRLLFRPAGQSLLPLTAAINDGPKPSIPDLRWSAALVAVNIKSPLQPWAQPDAAPVVELFLAAHDVHDGRKVTCDAAEHEEVPHNVRVRLALREVERNARGVAHSAG